MNHAVTVKNVKIGEGNTKIFIPIVGETQDEIVNEAKNIKSLSPDVVEWRVDFYENVESIDYVLETLTKLRKILNNIPILFTFRTIREGGNKAVSDKYYVELNCVAIGSKHRFN